MSITTGKVIMCTGLAALALAACGGTDATNVEGTTSTGSGIAGVGGDGGGGAQGAGGLGGSGGGGGQGGTPEIPVADVIDCEGTNPVIFMTGEYIPEPPDYIYIPTSEVYLKIGEVIHFEPFGGIRNIESGVFPVQDLKFATPFEQTACLRFNFAGDYPFFAWKFWSMNANGTIHVQPL